MKIAVNKNVIGKPDSSHRQIHAVMTKTYKNLDITPERLAEFVQKGYAFCAQHKNQWRKSANFTACDFLTVDIDDDMTLEEALENVFVQSFASFIYTTASHSENFHKFRIVFALEETITDSKIMKAMYIGLAVKFGGDLACTDACRQFYGSEDCEVFFIGKMLPEHQLTQLALLVRDQKNHVVSRGPGQSENQATVRSKISIDIDTLVTDDSGIEHRMGDTTAGMRVHCPVHLDTRTSAFIIQSQNGVLGVHCMTCRASYFTSYDIPFYDFNYDLRQLKALPEDQISGEVIKDSVIYETRSIYIQNDQYLEPMDTDTPMVLVKSPKGSGKTQWLEHVVKKAKSARLKENKISNEKRGSENKAVLLIGHRQSLITALAERLGLKSYMEFPSSAGMKNTYNAPSDYYAICADSLSTRLNPKYHKYPIVIIDEVEQVLTHLTQATVKQKRREIFLHFKHYLNVAEKIYVMDADLNELTVNSLHDCLDDKSKEVTVIINDYKPSSRSISLYSNERHLINDMVSDALAGKKLFVCSNSINQVKRLHSSLKKISSDSLKILSVTSENSSAPEIQSFIRNIKSKIKEYDVVLASPSMGTGVDITLPNNEQFIDVVYGFFQARVNTHLDMDQQLSRVRHPKEVRVWVTPETFRFETDVSIIKQEIQNSMAHDRKLVAINDDGTYEFENAWDEKYLNLYANVQSIERGSKNRLRAHFKKLKEFQGWEVTEVVTDKESAKKGSKIYTESKEELEDERLDRTLNAKIITRKEYRLLWEKSESGRLASDQKWAMRRFEIESFYLQPIDRELIELDNNGKYRRSIIAYINYTQDHSKLIELDTREIRDDIYITDRKSLLHRQELLFRLLHSAGLANDSHRILPNVEIQKDDLTNFVTLCKRLSAGLARLFDMDINRDINTKPTSQLGKIVKLTGLTWINRQVRSNGIKTYLYSIPQSEIDQIDQYAARYQDEDLRYEWHQAQLKITENRLFDSENETLHLQFNNQIHRELDATRVDTPLDWELTLPVQTRMK